MKQTLTHTDRTQNPLEFSYVFSSNLLLMEEILHQVVDSLSKFIPLLAGFLYMPGG